MQPRVVGKDEAGWITGRARIELRPDSEAVRDRRRGPQHIGSGLIITRLVRLRHHLAELAIDDEMVGAMLVTYGLDWPSDPAAQ